MWFLVGMLILAVFLLGGLAGLVASLMMDDLNYLAQACVCFIVAAVIVWVWQ